MNKQDENKYYPLLSALAFDNIEIVQLMIEHAHKNKIKLKFNIQDKYGNYPIYYSIRNNKIIREKGDYIYIFIKF